MSRAPAGIDELSVLSVLDLVIRQTVPATLKHSSHTLEVPAKRYRIGELVRCSPFSRQTIHNYTIMGLIREAEWTEGGHRLYDESVFSRLSRILELRETKSLTEIRHILTQEENVATAPIDEHCQDVGEGAQKNGLGHINASESKHGGYECQDQSGQNA